MLINNNNRIQVIVLKGKTPNMELQNTDAGGLLLYVNDKEIPLTKQEIEEFDIFFKQRIEHQNEQR